MKSKTKSRSKNKKKKSLSNLVVFALNKQAQKQVTFFKKSKYPLSFKPFLVAQGLAVVLLLFVAANFLIPQQSINPELIIKTAVTKQISTVVVSQPVRWTALVKRSDITSNQYLLKLPDEASNIKIKTLTANQAKLVLQSKPTEQVSLQQRQQLAKSNQPKSFFIASLLNSVSELFVSDDSIVDLSNQAPKPVESGHGMLVLAEEVVPAPVVEEAPATPGVDETSVPEIVETPAVVEPVLEEISVETEIPVEVEAPVEELVDPVIQPDVPSNDGTNTSPSDLPVVEPTPELIVEEYVAVEYETPAPEITEQETDSGKVVTISSPTTECKIPTESTPVAEPAPVVDEQAGEMISGIVKEAVKQLKENGEINSETIINDVTKEVEENQTIDQPILETTSPSDSSALEASIEIVENTSPSDQETSLVEYQECLAQQVQLTDVLAFTTIPEIYKVGQEDKIKIKWTNNDNQEVTFHASDTNNNGKLDYVEWTVPHLSTQIFEIIFISKAFYLDSNREILEDIYDTVKEQDGNFATINNNEYVRVTFEQILDSTKDITLFTKPTAGSVPVQVEVYPVYMNMDGNMNEGLKLELVNDGENPDFSNIDHDGKYRVLLTNLQMPTDVFDLKIISAHAE